MTVIKVVNMHEAKTNLSRLVGEEFLIARNGVPIARVIPIRPTGKANRGFHLGVAIPDDFDSMFGEEIADSFDGSPRASTSAGGR